MYKKCRTSNVYSFFLALLPIMDLYKSGISVITFGEVGLIIFTLITLKKMLEGGVIFGRNYIKLQPIIFILSLFFISGISFLFLSRDHVSVIDVFNRFIRLVLWAFSISFTGYYLYQHKITRKWVIKISLLATFYIIIQLILWKLSNIYLPSVINTMFIRPVSEGYANTSALSTFYKDRFIRPASFFGEPAYYAYYALLGLVLSLFTTVNNNPVIGVFLSLGIIVSTSTAGIYLMIICWIYYGYTKVKGNNFIIKALKILPVATFLLTALFLVSILLYDKIGSSEYFYGILTTVQKPLDFSSNARLGGSFKLFSNFHGVQKYVGVGLGNEDIYLGIEDYYLNSITILLLSTGYLGVITYFIFINRLISNKQTISFILVIMYLILSFTSSTLYSSISILYLTIALYTKEKGLVTNCLQIDEKNIYEEI